MRAAMPLSRRDFATAAALTLLAACKRALPVAAARSTAPAAWPGYSGAIVIDGCGSPAGYDPQSTNDDDPFPDWMIRAARSSGLTAMNVTVDAGSIGSAAPFEDTIKEIAYWEREIDRHPDVFMKVKTGADLHTAKATGKLGLIYGFQNTEHVAADLTRLDAFQRLGVRIVQVSYNGRGSWGDGCLEPANGGLTPLGREVVARLDALGVVIDASHCGQRTTAEAIATSKRPIAITHAGCAALVDRPRNKRDEELRALAQKGGVVGIYLMPFIREHGQPLAEDVVRHIEHAIDVCGEDHVGVGTDGELPPVEVNAGYIARHREFVASRRKKGIAAPGEDESVYNFVPDLNTPRKMETLALRLHERGHGDERIEKILGGNFARLFREIWT